MFAIQCPLWLAFNLITSFVLCSNKRKNKVRSITLNLKSNCEMCLGRIKRKACQESFRWKQKKAMSCKCSDRIVEANFPRLTVFRTGSQFKKSHLGHHEKLNLGESLCNSYHPSSLISRSTGPAYRHHVIGKTSHCRRLFFYQTQIQRGLSSDCHS